MKPAWAAMLVALGALAVGIGTSVVSGSTVRLGIAYETGTGSSAPDVWLAGSDGGSRRRLGPGQTPLLSPNGAFVAASSAASRGAALILYAASGGVAHRFFDLATATARAQAWSQDSRYLAVVLSSANPYSDAGSGLAVIDTSTDKFRLIARGTIDGASFAPDGSDRLAYASAASHALSASVNIHVVAANGSGRLPITTDGRSLNPVWGKSAIAFDHERLRAGAAPVFQVWLMKADGSHRAQETNVSVPPLMQGLVPLGFSGDGRWLLAEYEGQDTSQAWLLNVASGRLRKLAIASQEVSGAAIARHRSEVLVDRGGFLNPPSSGVVESLPLSGGRPRTLIPRGSEPSWNL